MRYMFRILALGSPDLTIPFLYHVGVEPDDFGTNDELHAFNTEIAVEKNACNLELLVPKRDNANYDEILETTDGLLYFVNPASEQDFHLFEMLVEVLLELDRKIPTVVVFTSQQHVLPVPWNLLSEVMWRTYPQFEVFFYPSTSTQSRVHPLACLCAALIHSRTPINLATAWIRFPVVIKLANEFVERKQYEPAAACAKAAFFIARHLGLGDFQSFAEKAAYLMVKTNNFLEAAYTVAEVDPSMSARFRHLYVDYLIRAADTLFKKKDYKQAAETYETAANWAKTELGVAGADEAETAFKRAINSWISACEFPKFLPVLKKLDHQKKLDLLDEITPRIEAAADFLIDLKKYELAKNQLYVIIDTYQREGRFESLELITRKIQEVLVLIFRRHVELKDREAALATYEEIENITDTFDLEPVALADDLVALCKLYLNNREFNRIDEIIPHIADTALQAHVTELRAEAEDQLALELKESLEQDLARGYERLARYAKEEKAQFQEIISDKIREARAHVEADKPLYAAELLENQGKWFNQFNLSEYAENVHARATEFYIQAIAFDQAIALLTSLSKPTQEKLLQRVTPLIEGSIECLFDRKGLDAAVRVLERITKIYRILLLYKASRRFAELQLELLKKKALALVAPENLEGDPRRAIEQALELMRRAGEVSESYLDGEKVVHDPLYSRVTHLYIELDDMANAEAALQKIQDRATFSEIHEKILKLDAEKSEAKTKVAQKKLEDAILTEQITLLQNRAREVKLTKREEFQKREALKRRYYQRGLTALDDDDLETALEAYAHSANLHLRRKQYKQAGLSFLVHGLIELTREGHFARTEALLEGVYAELGTGASILRETFSIKLVEFLAEMERQDQEILRNQALGLAENLPLFAKELALVNQLAGTAFESMEEKAPARRPATSGVGKVDATSAIEAAATPSQAGKGESKAKQTLSRQKKRLRVEHKFSAFREQTRDVKSSSADVLQGRTALKRAFFRKVMAYLETKNFEALPGAYREAAIKLNKRRDYTSAGVAVCLGALALIHAGKTTADVRDYVDTCLADFGTNEKVVHGTFFIQLVLALMAAKEIDDAGHVAQGWKLLDLLPLFEEERPLLQRPASF